MTLETLNAAAFIGVILASLVISIQGIRKRKGADLDGVAADVRQVLAIVDKTEHEIAVLRREVGYAQAHSESTATRLKEHEDDVDRRLGAMGEALSNRLDLTEAGLRRVIEHIDQGDTQNA